MYIFLNVKIEFLLLIRKKVPPFDDIALVAQNLVNKMSRGGCKPMFWRESDYVVV